MPARPPERARRDVLLLAAAAPVAAAFAGAAPARASGEEAEVRDLVARWYGELRQQEEGRPDELLVSHAALYLQRRPDPDESCFEEAPKSAGPRFGFYLAYNALRFSYEVRETRIDPGFAKLRVWERGWRYASKAERTYQLAAWSTFVLERDAEGAWRILLYDTYGMTIPAEHRDEPMPDLSHGIHEAFVYRP